MQDGPQFTPTVHAAHLGPGCFCELGQTTQRLRRPLGRRHPGDRGGGSSAACSVQRATTSSQKRETAPDLGLATHPTTHTGHSTGHLNWPGLVDNVRPHGTELFFFFFSFSFFYPDLPSSSPFFHHHHHHHLLARVPCLQSIPHIS